MHIHYALWRSLSQVVPISQSQSQCISECIINSLLTSYQCLKHILCRIERNEDVYSFNLVSFAHHATPNPNQYINY